MVTEQKREAQRIAKREERARKVAAGLKRREFWATDVEWQTLRDVLDYMRESV